MFESQMIVLFGATGDLAKRKLIPSLYRLVAQGKLSLCTPIICLGRRSLDKEGFLQLLELEEFIPDADQNVLAELVKRIEYVCFDPSTMSAEEFKKEILRVKNRHQCTSNMLFYLSVPPSLFDPIISLIAPLKELPGFKRVVFEKPFGYDLASAVKLNGCISEVFEEQEVFRIDHYVGKELVRNILALRFANSMFEKVWDGQEVESVQITAAESLGVGSRAGYYEHSGAMRDMVQNHLLQVLSLVAMEPPVDLSADAVRDRTVEVLRQLRPVTAEDIVFGQYDKGSIDGQPVKAYREESGVSVESLTETFAALRLFVDSPRWQGVPFFVRTGKRLGGRFAEIKMVFRHTSKLFAKAEEHDPNMIVIRIQPDEGVAVRFNAKRPGGDLAIEPVLMDFCHPCHFGPNTPEAYESLLEQVMQGDQTLFTRWDWLEESWRFVDALRKVAGRPVLYRAGSMGPTQAADLLSQVGLKWV